MRAGDRPPVPRWRIAPADSGARDALATGIGVSSIVAQVLINRGLADQARARAFLDTRLDRLRGPFELAQMDNAVERLVGASRERVPIVVYGDYDADGVTATAMLVRTLRLAGATVDFYIPDRRTEGYGLHAAAVGGLTSAGARLLVAVDCGITATAAAEAARAFGVELIILDHHEPLGSLLPAAVIVNPKLTGYPTEYSAAGLAFQACRGVLSAIGREEAEPDLIGLAALGTVADAVELLEDNRIITARGLEQLSRSTMPGVVALREAAGLQSPLRVRDLSHALAPRLNAAGRLSHAGEAVRLLIGDDLDECRRIAADLDRLNQERRALCDRVLAEAVEEVEADRLDKGPAIVLARHGWHPGVVGIVASQLVERYYRPTVVISLQDGIGKGSARSIPPLHLVRALSLASGTLMAYGGHAMAAGLTVAPDAIARFRSVFLDAVGALLSHDDLVPITRVDAEVTLAELTRELAVEIERLSPFGAGNEEPVFLARGLRAVGTRLAGGGAHLRLLVGDGAQTAEAIGFRFGDYAELLAFTQAQIDLACTIQTHQWGGAESIQLVVVGLATPGVDPGAIATDTGAVLARLFARADDYLDGHLVEVEQAPAFHTKVVGVTFDGRQAILPAVRPGEFLQLIRDPGNPVDPHAIKVCLADGRQLGFLRAALSARLAPAIDAGARYSATAASVTGGGDRAHGLNIYVVREASWSAEASERAAPWVRHPSGPGFADWLSVRLYRGRALSAPQRDVIGALLSGERVVGRFGPGRGLAGIAAMGAAALTARGDGPVMIVLPRVADVEAWRGLMDAWCRDIGLRAGMLHGAMAARDTAWSSSAWERGEVDVLLASTSWAVEHAPASRAVVVALDGLSFGEDLAALLDRYGERVRLVLGTAPLDHLERAAVRLRMGRVVTDPTPRVNLRVVDRRGRPDSEITLTTGLRPERTLVVAADARAGVAAARELRARHPGMADRIAYYHDGLPGTLRRVLEDLFAAGQITTLVTGTHLVDPSLPVDVARVIAIGLPTDRLLAADLLGAGGLGGRTAVVELGFGAEALEAIQAAVETRFPTREMLARCYHRLRERFHGGSWTSTGGVPAGVEDQALSAAAIGSCLDVFVEAGVLTREGGDDSGIGYALIDPNDRVDLDRSLRYREGVRARTAWKDLREWATGPVAAILADLARS